MNPSATRADTGFDQTWKICWRTVAASLSLYDSAALPQKTPLLGGLGWANRLSAFA